MNIKEIAKLAGVSISTVSKIMNGKDESIGRDTREKVLQIAKEYNYTPYSHVVGNGRKFLLGMLLGDSKEEEQLFLSANQCAGENGYSMVWCRHHDSLMAEQQGVARLCSQNIEGVIWRRVSEESREFLHYFEERNIQVFYCDSLEEEEHQLYVDYGRLGYEAAASLIEKKHINIACVHEMGPRSDRFMKGVQRCFYDRQIEWREDQFLPWTESFTLRDFRLYGITALICENAYLGRKLLKIAVREGVKIPEDLSLITVGMKAETALSVPNLTAVRNPVEQWGRNLCNLLLQILEDKEIPPVPRQMPLVIDQGETVLMLSGKQQKKIVVVGTVNMDAVINVEELAELGKTVMAQSMVCLPGGKGSNQAVGAAKLGACVYLIGKIGRDYEGRVLYDDMLRNGVKLQGVSETGDAGTGKAYILVQKNGESSIIVYSGANQLLTEQDITLNQSLFEDADFCLLQLESPYQIVEYAARMAVKHGVKVILKPSTARKVTDSLLGMVDIFVPNHKELNNLYPEPATLEEKAEYFLDKGVKHVIVTLGHHGCYLKNRDQSLYFSAASFKPVDTTGAADAFISALAVYLQDGIEMESAVRYAIFSAGLSITRPGVQSSMPDRQTLELYKDELERSIRVSGTKMF